MISYHYLASPYSHPDPEVRHFRYELTEEALACLLRKKIWCYSPIVHCHNMAKRLKMPTDAAFRQEYNHVMIRAARSLFVLCIDGWDKSVGVKEEMEFSDNYSIPVKFVIPQGSDYIVHTAPVIVV